jgi:hypothetical protein
VDRQDAGDDPRCRTGCATGGEENGHREAGERKVSIAHWQGASGGCYLRWVEL